MDLTNEFRVSVPVEDAWNVLTDVERIAPCLPGAQLQEIEGDEFRGVVKVKVGPITAQYKGKATFEVKDDEAHLAVLKAEGRDTRGQGNASARITATLTPDGDGTKVVVDTHLTITGKVAQFGRGVLVDVSSKLLTQFVECLEQDLLSSVPVAASAANGAAAAPEAAKPAAMTPPAPAKTPAKPPAPVAASAAPAAAKPAPVPAAPKPAPSPVAPAAKAPPAKVEAPVEKSVPEPIAASAAPAAAAARPAPTPATPAAPAAKVEAPVEKATPEPVAAAPKAPAAASATPPHGDPVEPVTTPAATAATPPSAPTPKTETATPPHGDALTDEAPKPTVRKIEHKAAEPVDLLDAAGVPVAKRAIPVVAGVLVILWFLRRRRARRR